ncbi:MAG TPA: CBS domain-containing protein [Prosthecobacter sp.]
MKINEIMTSEVKVIKPETPLQDAAGFMRELSIGALPVCDGKKLIGMLTDRDIVVRAVADGLDISTTTAAECMTAEITFCFDDEELEAAEGLMKDQQIRRLPVVDREKQLVGILSLGDIAIKTDEVNAVGQTLQDISQPEGEI